MGSGAEAIPHSRTPGDRKHRQRRPRSPARSGRAQLPGHHRCRRVLQAELEAREIPAVSLRAGIPHYLMNAEHPQATAAWSPSEPRARRAEHHRPQRSDQQLARRPRRDRRQRRTTQDVRAAARGRIRSACRGADPDRRRPGSAFEDSSATNATTDDAVTGRRLSASTAAAKAVEVGDDVVDRLDADAEAHEPGRRLLAAVVGSADCGSCSPDGSQAAHVADVGHVAVQLEPSTNFFRCPPDLDRTPSRPARRRRWPLVGLDAPLVDRLDLIVAVEVLGHLLRVGEVALHPQAQRLDALRGSGTR